MRAIIILAQILALLIPNSQTTPPIWLNNQQTISGFPETITFQASFSGNAELEEISLIYGVEQDTCGEVEAIAYPGFDKGESVDVQWTWDMRQSGSIPPGARIWWRWEVQDFDGNTFSTEEQNLIWLDDTHSWQVVQSGQVSLHYYFLDYAAAIDLLNHAVISLELLSDETGISTAQPIDIYIYGSTDDLRQSILYEPGWTGGLAYPENNIVLIGISPDDLVWGKSTIAHELTHLLVGDYSFSCLGSLPTWLQEGLAVLGEGGPDSGSIIQFEEAKTDRKLISFNILSGSFSEDPDKANLSYSQSYYMVEYLVQSYGREKISQLLKTLAKGTELSDAMDEVYGFDLAGFERQWREEIGVPLAGTDTTVQGPTQTPTIIPTIIPIQGGLPQESKTITPVIAATGTPTPSSIPTTKPGEFDTRPFVFLFLALTCLIGIVAIALLIILISRSARKKNIASVLIFFLFATGIPFLSARGDDATPTPYPPVPTATAYVPMAVEEGTYADAVEGIFLKIPESVLLVPPEEDTGSMVDFNFSDYSIWGFLFPSQMDSSASLEENASDILKSSLTGLTDQQIVESKEKILPSGVHAWYSEVVAYNPSDNTNYQFGFLTVKGNINGLTLTTFSTPDYYSQYRYLVDELHDSLEIRPTSISGFSRDEVLILEGGETSNPRENDPATSHTGSDNLVFSGLVTYNTHMEVIPDLAENWEISPDRLTYTFRLNPTAVFHNGRPVTAEDVIFSWERAANPATDSDTVLTYLGDIVGIREMRAGKTGHVQGLAALDAHTLQVTIDEPKLYFLQKLTYPTTFIVDKENVALGEEWYRTPNGTGPYRLNRWESMTQKIYERFEDFYGEKPRIKGIIINLYSGDSTRLYESGSIDMTGIATYNIDRFKDPNEPMHQELYSTPNLCTSYITLDVTRPPFDDLKVRQAFAMAIDRELYIRVVHNNAAIPAHGLYPPALPGYDYSFTGLEFNPEKARQYLKESGYTPENIPEIIYSSAGYGSSISTADAAVIQMWEENLGIKVKVQNIEPEYYLENLIDDNTGQITQEGWCADYPDPENFADALYHTGAEMNTSGYSNPELDVLLEQARSELDTTSRILLYQQAERIIVEEVPAIFLSHSISFTLVKPYVQGYVEAPMAIPFERYLWIDPAKLPNP